MTIGADRGCDLVLDDGKVSRRHLEVSGTPEGLFLKDLGSRNGTRFHASRIEQAVVPAGSSVEVGSTTLRFVASHTPVLPPSPRSAFGALVGRSVAMRELFAVLELASPTDATVLVQGESGTGKELAARAIHDHSRRAGGPFVVVDCGAVSDQLAESQLFGHKKGAFTGAIADRKGAFVEASGGTLFLDELGELTLEAQARLLRAIEQRVVTAVGSDKPVAVDTRIVAATHRNLASMVEQKTFRFDLFHRLAVVHVDIPPLRAHLEDLPALVSAFYADRGVDAGEIAGANLERLRAYPWPGNVRELRNVLERAFVLAGPTDRAFAQLSLWLGDASSASSSEPIDTHLPFKEAKERWVESFARRYLAAVYEEHGENITRASEHAGHQPSAFPRADREVRSQEGAVKR